ncbi:oligosaccharide repeat unit polymerase [Clostridiales bacterium FE2010]|nr:oligosaccharide repeat unit polymerase [Clostridiales bacterium FE2010]
MVLGLLVIFTFLFLIINFKISKCDFMNPAVLFCGLFFIYELICVIGTPYYEIELHIETLFVLLAGFIIFSFSNIIYATRKGNGTIPIISNKYIHLPNSITIALIIIQIITCYFFIRYLRSIAAAYGLNGSLDDMINLYDKLTKFWTETFNRLNVTIPMPYRIGNLITTPAAYLVLYVMVNNFVVRKKVNIYQIAVIGLLCVQILLNGSRSPLLRIFTFVLAMMYILKIHQRGYRGSSFKFFFKIIKWVLIVAVLMFITLYAMGRGNKIGNIWNYIFIYTGAPIVNLDTYISSSNIQFVGGQSVLFGAQTLKGFYSYLAKVFNISALRYAGIGSFAFSNNGIEIGNVYTTYFKIIYDFGYIGILPMMLITSTYYCKTYQKSISNKKNRIIDLRLFYYAYLFNDLVMLPFSARFYETISEGIFIKLVLAVWLLDIFIFENSVHLFGKKLKIPALRM